VYSYEHEKLPYDARLDLLPIASVATVVLAISVPDNLEARTLRELAALFGAWIAAEIAVKCTTRLSRLIMASAVGIKVGDRENLPTPSP